MAGTLPPLRAGKEKQRLTRRMQEELLLAMLPLVTGRSFPSLPGIARGPFGKPFMPDLPDFHYNFSDSGPYVILAASDRPVGADLQEIRRGKYTGIPLAERFFADSEVSYLKSLQKTSGEEAAEHAFFRLWSMKEAWFKLTGRGIFHDGISRCTSEALTGGAASSEPFPVADTSSGTPLAGWEREIPLPFPGYVLLVAAWEKTQLQEIRWEEPPHTDTGV